MNPVPKLYYFFGRGRAEPIRWMLAAGGLEFEEIFLTSREQYLQFKQEKRFLYEQVPMLEIDGMRLVQTRAILQYVARKFDMYGASHKEQAVIDMYAEGIVDGFLGLIGTQFIPEQERENYKKNIIDKLHSRYLPVFENAILKSPTGHIAGTENMSLADVLLLDSLLVTLENDPAVLQKYENLNGWLEKVLKLPWVVKFLSSEGKRKPKPDQEYVANVARVFGRV